MIYEKTRLATFLSSFINFNFSLFAASVAATLFVLRLSKPKPNNFSELSGNEKFFSSESVLFFSQLENQYRKLPMKKRYKPKKRHSKDWVKKEPMMRMMKLFRKNESHILYWLSILIIVSILRIYSYTFGY